MTKKNNRKEIINKVAGRLIELLKTEGSNWKKSEVWNSSEFGLPVNAKTKKSYSGFNVFNLLIERDIKKYDNNEWGTYNMWKSMGYNVKAKEKATYIFYNDKFTVEDEKKLDENGNPRKKQIWYLKPHAVFNANQVEGYEIKKSKSPNKAKNNSEANKYIANTEAVIQYGGDRAYYSPSSDYIQIPNKKDFHSSEKFYGTLLHELVHWTGNKNRLDRDFSGQFGSDAYAIEELVAETGSAILSAILGISQTVRADHAKYINSWIEQLQNKPEQVIKAINKSSRAVEFLDSLQNKGEKKKVA